MFKFEDGKMSCSTPRSVTPLCVPFSRGLLPVGSVQEMVPLTFTTSGSREGLSLCRVSFDLVGARLRKWRSSFLSCEQTCCVVTIPYVPTSHFYSRQDTI